MLSWLDVSDVRVVAADDLRPLEIEGDRDREITELPVAAAALRRWNLLNLAGGALISIPSAQFAVRKELAAYAVNHYFHHPEDRAELGDDRALQRIQALIVAVESDPQQRWYSPGQSLGE